MDGVFHEMFADPSWMAWRALCAAAFGLPMTPEMLEVYRTCTGRQDAPTTPVKELFLICGRRAGKSRILALIAVYFAIARDYAAYLGPGELAVIPVVASDTDQAKVIFRYILGMLDSVPGLSSAKSNETQDSVIVNGQVKIEIHAASYRGLRGSSYPLCVVDELAHLRTSDYSANPDREIVKAIRGGLLNIPGSMLWGGSTPYAEMGVLWDMHKRHYGQDNSRTLIWKSPSWAMNPTLDPSEIKEAYDQDPEGAASELGAEFRSGLAAFVSREVVEACVEPGCYERAPALSAGKRYMAFLDAAGGSGSDSMVVCVSHMEDGIPVIDAIRERKPQFRPSDVVAEFADLLHTYGVRSAQSDKWGGSWVIEAFAQHKITVTPSAKPKSDLYREALPMLNQGACALLDHPRTIAQLCSLERRTARGGRDSIDHPPGAGSHDDCANATVGALLMPASVRKPIVISDATLERIRTMPRRPASTPFRPRLGFNAR
ncbi:hypothetical protein FE263_16350 [Lichenicoccus roseus]|uniref:Terminase n=2 Tax=Lichenicoccus roseus TaxID=2683649 RepID=A0A5R9J8B0_9PROT|nr:hypothetical protein FE263_16350 [Lichenicoccus roseus]